MSSAASIISAGINAKSKLAGDLINSGTSLINTFGGNAQKQKYMRENMATAQGYTQDNMVLGQNLAQKNMSYQNDLALNYAKDSIGAKVQGMLDAGINPMVAAAGGSSGGSAKSFSSKMSKFDKLNNKAADIVGRSLSKGSYKSKLTTAKRILHI